MGESDELWDEFSERVRDLETEEIAPDLISPFLALPGLRGFWPMSAFGATGQAFDQSANVRTLTYNGNPTYNYSNLVPYLDMDGTGDFLSRADEAGLDILGTETIIASAIRGLSMGGWFWFNNAAAARENCMSKWVAAGNQKSYRLVRSAAGNLRGLISVDGTVSTDVGAQAVGAGAWVFGAMIFDPSTELSIFTGLDDLVKDTLTVGVPASIFNSNSDFRIGSDGTGADLMTGRASLCWLCATFLGDAIIESLFERTRGAFEI